MRLSFLISTMRRVSRSLDAVCIMLWLALYFFGFGFVLLLWWQSSHSCKSLRPSVWRPVRGILKCRPPASPRISSPLLLAPAAPCRCLFPPLSQSSLGEDFAALLLFIKLSWFTYMCCALLSRFICVRLFATGQSLPGSSVHGILQARILEWVSVPSSRGSSRPRDRTHISCVSCIGKQVLYH